MRGESQDKRGPGWDHPNERTFQPNTHPNKKEASRGAVGRTQPTSGGDGVCRNNNNGGSWGKKREETAMFTIGAKTTSMRGTGKPKSIPYRERL